MDSNREWRLFDLDWYLSCQGTDFYDLILPHRRAVRQAKAELATTAGKKYYYAMWSLK